MTTSVRVPNAITGDAVAAIEGRGGWTWAWAGDDATEVSWPGLSDFGGAAATLTPAGAYALAQPTRDLVLVSAKPTSQLSAAGVGSARIDNAVTGGTGVGFEAASFPNPISQTLHVRLVLSDPGTDKLTGTLTYFELSEAAQRLSIKRADIAGSDGLISVLRVETELGVNVVEMPALPFVGAWFLLDVIADFTTGAVKMFFSGVDVTPALGAAPGALTPFGSAPSVALLSKVGGTESSEFVSLVFAGVAVGRNLQISEHREDADKMGTLLNGSAVALDPEFTSSYVGDMATVEKSVHTSWLPYDPFEDITRVLTVSESSADDAAVQLVLHRSTGATRPEGLGRPRVDRGVQRSLTSPLFRRTASELTLDLAEPLFVRLIVELDYLDQFGGAGDPRTLFALEDSVTPTNRVTIKTNADVSTFDVEVTSAFTASVAAPAEVSPKWALIDLRYQPTGGAGGESRVELWVNGVALIDTDHTSPLTGLFGLPTLTLLSLADGTEPASGIALALAGVLVDDDVHSFEKAHQMGALALGVY